jgi:hypothetical protein
MTMKKIEKIDRQRQQDREIALLALGVDKEEQGERSSCPDDGEIAALLDGQCPGEERKRLQAHISSCDECRGRCLQVGMALMEVNRSPGRSKARIYTWASAFLAAAACVVLFLAIDTTPPWQKSSQLVDDEVSVPSAQVRSKTVKKVDRQPVVSHRNRVQAKGAASEKTVTGIKSARPGGGPEKIRQVRQVLSMKKKVSDLEKVGQEEIAPVSSSMLMADKVADDGQPSARIREWYALLQEACARKENSPVIWQALYREGQKILPSTSLRARQDVQVLLGRMNQTPKSGDGTESVCTALQTILEHNK